MSPHRGSVNVVGVRAAPDTTEREEMFTQSKSIERRARFTPRDHRLRTIWTHGVRPLAITVLLISSFRSAVADWNDVPSQSMEPTILTGDRIVVNRLAYDLRVPFTRISLISLGSPERGDVVIFRAPHNDRRMVKRVIGVPGDELALDHNRLILNGTPVDLIRTLPGTMDDLRDPPPHFYATECTGDESHLVMFQPDRTSCRSIPTLTVPDGHYFMMGDNRDNSGDSREFGLVPRSAIMGRVVGVAFSVDLEHGYVPRWDRIAEGL